MLCTSESASLNAMALLGSTSELNRFNYQDLVTATASAPTHGLPGKRSPMAGDEACGRVGSIQASIPESSVQLQPLDMTKLGSKTDRMDMDSVMIESGVESDDGMIGSNSTGNHACPECGKRYSTSSNLARHRQTHRSVTDQKARKCPHCDKVYVSMPALSMHIRYVVILQLPLSV